MGDTVRAELRADGLVTVEADFRYKDDVKSIPGSLWDSKERIWTVRRSWAACQQLRGIFDDRLEVGPELNAWAEEDYRTRVYPCLQYRVMSELPPDDPYGRAIDEIEANLPDTLRLTPLQRVAVAFMCAGKSVLEGDPMGSGKTPITIMTLAVLDHLGVRSPYPMLIVCGHGAKPHWRNDYHQWAPWVRTQVIEGAAKVRREQLKEEAQVFAVNWELMAKLSKLAGYGSIRLSDKEKEPKELNEAHFNTIVVDEIHRAKDVKSKQSRAVMAVADECDEVYGLTGSLVGNTPVDAWSPGRIVAPDEYPTKSKFVTRYGLLSWGWGGHMKVVGLRGEHRDEFYRFLDPRHIRRPKEVILPQLEGKLPPIRRVVDLPSKQRKAYDKMREEMLTELEGGTLMATNPMARMQRLRQLAGATGVIDDEGNLTLKSPSAKVDELINVVNDLAGDSVCVYAESRLLIELADDALRRKGISSGMFTGATKATREEHREKFQAGELQVLLLTYGAGAESINLSRADALVRLEFSWSAIKNSQALERPVRPGRKGPLRVIDIVAHDTVDEAVIQTYSDKLDMLEQVVRDKETLELWLSK